MNLAKKGTVLLAALSVFAMASCGSKKDNTMTYKQAKEWVKEHYTKTKTKGKVTKNKVVWDYTKNVKDEVVPEDFPMEAFRGADINFFSAYAINMGWPDLNLTEEEITKTSGNVEKDGAGELSEWGSDNLVFMNLEEFEKEYDAEPRRFEYAFSVENSCLVIKRTFINDREVVSSYGIRAYWLETDTMIFDKEGYLDTLKWTMDNSDMILDFTDVGSKPVNFGEMHLSIENSVVEVTPIN